LKLNENNKKSTKPTLKQTAKYFNKIKLNYESNHSNMEKIKIVKNCYPRGR